MEGVSQEVTQFYQASLGGERSDGERRNLAKARYMALDRYPVTDLANELCRVVGDYLINTDRKRKNRRGKEALEKYHGATGAVIADLMLGFRRAEKLPRLKGNAPKGWPRRLSKHYAQRSKMAAHRFVIISSLAVRLVILCRNWLFMDGVASPVRSAQLQ